MKKFLVLVTTVFMLFAASACSSTQNNETTEAGNDLKGSLSELVAKVCEKYDFSPESFVYSGSDDAADVLYLVYGVENPDILEDYVLYQRGDAKAATFAVFRFKDGTEKATITEFKDAIQYYYVEGMYKDFKLYNPDEYKIAEGASYKQYDNALVLAVYDTDGNNGIFQITDTFKK